MEGRPDCRLTWPARPFLTQSRQLKRTNAKRQDPPLERFKPNKDSVGSMGTRIGKSRFVSAATKAGDKQPTG